MPPLDSLIIRPAQPSDSEAIAAIYNESVAAGNATMDREPWSGNNVRTKLATAGDREAWLIAEQPATWQPQTAPQQTVVGWGAIKTYSDRWGYRVCCESSIYLSLNSTGQGYGSKLQAALLAKARDLRYHHVVAKIMAANQSSIRFHQRFGFEIVGCQKEIGYLNGRWHDVVILQLIFPEVIPDELT